MLLVADFFFTGSAKAKNRDAKKLCKRLTPSISAKNDSATLHKSTQTTDLKTRDAKVQTVSTHQDETGTEEEFYYERDAKVQTVSSSHGHGLRTDEELRNEGNVDTGSITRIHESQTFLPKGSKTHRRYGTLHDVEDFEREAKHKRGFCEIL